MGAGLAGRRSPQDDVGVVHRCCFPPTNRNWRRGCRWQAAHMDVCAGHQGGEGEQLPRSGSRRCGHTSSAASGKACTASWRLAWERTAAATVRAIPHAVVSDVEECSCACRSVDYLLSRQLEDGNFPQLASDQEKHVVHWCHGAPGLTALCCEAFRAFHDSKYLAIARRCCDVCWHRGILKKGFGLCHGIAGNALASSPFAASRAPTLSRLLLANSTDVHRASHGF